MNVLKLSIQKSEGSALKLLGHFKQAVETLNRNGTPATFDFSAQRHEVLHNNINGCGKYHLDVDVNGQNFVAAFASELPMQPSKTLHLYHQLIGIQKVDCTLSTTKPEQTAEALNRFAQSIAQSKQAILQAAERSYTP